MVNESSLSYIAEGCDCKPRKSEVKNVQRSSFSGSRKNGKMNANQPGGSKAE